MGFRRTRHLLCFFLPAAVLACGADGDAPALEREAFIETYVALRAEALLSGNAEISDEQRAQVLTEYQVSEDELLAFAEYHAPDVDYMKEVWDEVEERLDDLRPEYDEGGDMVRPIQRPRPGGTGS